MDTSKWQSFKLSDLFELVHGGTLLSEDKEQYLGNTNCVGGSTTDNGVMCKLLNCDYINQKMPYITKCCLTLGRVGDHRCYYQEQPFYLADNAVALIPKRKLTKSSLLFIATVISYAFKAEGYSHVISQKHMSHQILLPCLSNDTEPDWDWIEEYMNSIPHPKVQSKKTNKTLNLEDLDLHEFKLTDIGVVTKPKGIDFNKTTQEDPTVNYIGRSAENNGLNCKVDKIDGLKPIDGGVITIPLGGNTGYAFYQSQPFYHSQNIALFCPNDKLTTEALLYLCQIIRIEAQERYFAFGRELNSHIDKDFTVKLPAIKQSDGTYKPDWQKMNIYILGIAPYRISKETAK